MTQRSSRPENLNLPNHQKGTCTVNEETVGGTSLVSSVIKDSNFLEKNDESIIPLTKSIEKPKYKQINNKIHNVQSTQQNNYVNSVKKDNINIQRIRTSTKNLVIVSESEKNIAFKDDKHKNFLGGKKVKKKLKIREPFIDVIHVESFKVFNLKMTFCEWGTNKDEGNDVYDNDDDDDLCKQVRECFGKCVII